MTQLPVYNARVLSALCLVLPTLTSPTIHAAEFKLGESVQGKFNALATLGTQVRVEAPSADVIGANTAARFGIKGNLGGGAGASDLNFPNGRPVSSVIKTVADLELRSGNFGIFGRARAWYDYELIHGSRPFGHYPNRFVRNTPFNDDSYDAGNKFANAVVDDLYVFGNFKPSQGTRLNVRLGRQKVQWGTTQLFAGGLGNIVNPRDGSASNRPGAVADEVRIPEGMAYLNFGSGKNWDAEAFWQYEFRPALVMGCSQYLSTSAYTARGCDFVNVLPITETAALASGAYPKRNADVVPGASKQYGLSLTLRPEELNTEFRLYAANYIHRSSLLRITTADINGTQGSLAPPTYQRLTDPNGLKYGLLYVKDVRMFGASFDTKLQKNQRLYGELMYRPNLPVGVNSSDLIAAFVGRSPLSALNLAKGTNAIAPGGSFDGYDSFKVTMAALGYAGSFPQVLGAQAMNLTAELAYSHVAGLPDPGRLRYGRSDDYGVAAVTGGAACVDNSVAKKQCALKGFVTPHSWGVRLLGSARYANVIPGATLTLALGIAKDLSGNSVEGIFTEGALAINPRIRADWGRKYYAELSYVNISGGAYNVFIDRDSASLILGMRF